MKEEKRKEGRKKRGRKGGKEGGREVGGRKEGGTDMYLAQAQPDFRITENLLSLNSG